MTSAAVGTNQFWLRKLHSLTGFAFLGTFLSLHVQDGSSYGSVPRRVVLLLLPLLFHGLYGLCIAVESRPNALRYRWARNWMYLGQRATGLFLVAFVPLHVGAMEWGAAYGGALWYRGAWLAGLLAAVYHLSNGLFGTAVDWGVTVGPHSQKVLAWLCVVAFLVLAGYGLRTFGAF